MYRLTLIAAGSALGGTLRYLAQGWVQRLTEGAFPFGTLLVNVLGCFLIGFLNAAFTGPRLIREEYRIALTVGVLGGFTTFSAFGWETFALANDGQGVRALFNLLLSLTFCLTAVWGGYRLAESWLGV
jgi:fluoride exporter